jgi:hypothetical protein
MTPGAVGRGNIGRQGVISIGFTHPHSMDEDMYKDIRKNLIRER